MVRGPLPALLLSFLCVPLSRAAAQAGPGPEAVNAAIERGVDYLLSSQNRDGSWGVDLTERGTVWHDLRDGSTALAVYTLLKCGFEREHPALQRAVAVLLESEPRHTYATGVLLHVFGALGDPAHRKRMQALVALLLDLRGAGGWDYPGLNRADLSNTQVAALGLRAADAAGLTLPKSTWSDLVRIALRYQERPVDVPGSDPKEKRRMAGFAYEPGQAASASMTTAGLTILGIASEEDGRVEHKLRAELDEARELALAWLTEHYAIKGNPGGEAGWHYYYLYGLERVGAFFGLAEIAGHDWYREGAGQLLRSQRANGGWWNDGRSIWPPAPLATANTCFALLFLRKATLSQAGAARATFHAMEASDSDVWVRVDAKEPWTLWLSGFGPTVDPASLHVERVEWWLGGELVESVAGDLARPWSGERYAVQHAPAASGELAVECRVTVRSEDVAASSRELRSRPLAVQNEPGLEPWMLAYARDAAESVFVGQELELTASSEESAFHPKGDVLDGLQGSSWRAREDDPEPWIRLASARGVRISELWLSPAGASEVLREQCVSFTTVELRLNDAKAPLVVELERDPRLKTKVVLPRSTLVRTLELRVVDPPREPGKCVGFAEIEARAP
jgi:hypothetical protein